LSQRPQSRIIAHVRDGIRDGTYPAGCRLPSERDLAAKLQVTRSTVVRALSALGEEGVIRSNGGRLRIVTGDNDAKVSAAGMMRNTVVLLSVNSEGVHYERTGSGWSDRIDQGAMDEVRCLGRHHLAFNPALIDNGHWDEIIHANPLGIVVTDLFANYADVTPALVRARDLGVPIAMYTFEGDLEGVDRVECDHAQGAYEEVMWLFAQGKRRVLMLDPGSHASWFQRRREGYERAVSELGIEKLPLIPNVLIAPELGGHSEMAARAMAGYLIDYLNCDHPVDAILCASDGEMRHVDAACRILHKVPGVDLLLAGFDNYLPILSDAENRHVRPAVTVDKENIKLGAELARLVIDRAEGLLPAEPQRRLIAPRLVIPFEGD